MIRRSRVRQWFGEPKTEASRKPVPLNVRWPKSCCAGGRPLPTLRKRIFCFRHLKKGKQAVTPDMILKRVIRPAAEAAGIGKRVGWHTFRHSLATNIRTLGVDVKVAQELLRHANSRTTLDIYTQAVSSEKALANGRASETAAARNPQHPTAPSGLEGKTATC